jgi:hypothetical protein
MEEKKPTRDQTDVQNWYEDLKDITFPTWFLSITEEEAQCIIDYYDDQVLRYDSQYQ